MSDGWAFVKWGAGGGGVLGIWAPNDGAEQGWLIYRSAGRRGRFCKKSFTAITAFARIAPVLRKGPTAVFARTASLSAGLAQSVEQLIRNQKVASSILVSSTSPPLFDFSAVDFSHREECAVPTNRFKPRARFGLIVIGHLYQDQIFLSLNRPHPSLTQLRLLASITDLCQSRFAQQHDGKINLSNANIAIKTGGYFSPRQVGEHLQELKSDGLLEITNENGQRWIKIWRPSLDTFMREEYGAKFGYDVPVPDAVARKFMPWIDFEQGLIPDLNISEQFVLSYLTNEACIYARSDMGLNLPRRRGVNKYFSPTAF